VPSNPAGVFDALPHRYGAADAFNALLNRDGAESSYVIKDTEYLLFRSADGIDYGV
jgi:hypothetical protein